MALYGPGPRTSPFAYMQKFPRILNKADLGLTSDVVCQPNQWTVIGEYVVPAQTYATFGANDIINGGLTGRQLYIRLDNATTGQLSGKIRLFLSNATDSLTYFVMEERTERLSADPNDRSKCILLPEFHIKAKEDSKLLIKFMPDSSSPVTISAADIDTLLLVPVTIYHA